MSTQNSHQHSEEHSEHPSIHFTHASPVIFSDQPAIQPVQIPASVQVAQLVTPQSVQTSRMIPYPVAQRVGVVKSSAHLSILASLPVQAEQALAGPGPNPLAHDKQASALRHIKQFSPHAVQTLSIK